LRSYDLASEELRNVPARHIFLSHLHEDRLIATALQSILDEAFAHELGIFNSSDRESIRAGELWRDTIIRQLRDVAVLLVVATPESVGSPWVNFESGGAWVIDKTVIPCCAKGMTPATLPSPFSDLHAVDLSLEDDVLALVRELANRTGKMPIADYDFREGVDRLRQVSSKEVHFRIPSELESFLTSFRVFIAFPEEMLLSTAYRQLLDKHMPTIERLMQLLSESNEWNQIIEVKRRLRDYFELTGRYNDGVDFGRRYVLALDQIGRPLEAFWTNVKHVGYLLVLARRYSEARREFFETLRQVEGIDDAVGKLKIMFYCHRYLGITFQRDESTGDIIKAEHHFGIAREIVQSSALTEQERKPLLGRITGNFGNLMLGRKEYGEAIHLYSDELNIFRELGDREHVGIAHLKIAQGIIARGDDQLADAEDHLGQAEVIAMDIGWLEGQARIWEQRAKLCLLTVNRSRKARRAEILSRGLDHCRRSSTIFRAIGDGVGEGRVAAIVESFA
jgi:hypothetical protein